MSTQPDSQPVATKRRSPWPVRTLLLTGGVCLGSILTAGPMILSEWDGFGSPGATRLVIALVIGLMMMAFAIPGFWFKPMPRVLIGTFVPAIVAAVASAQRMDEDYCYLLVGVPVMMGSGLLMVFLLPARPNTAGRGFCHACGYDVRVASDQTCPECGEEIDEVAQVELPHRRHRNWLFIGLGGFVIAAVVQWLFIRVLLSLG